MAAPGFQWAGDMVCVPHQGVLNIDCAPAPNAMVAVPPSTSVSPNLVGTAPVTTLAPPGSCAAPFTQDQLSVNTTEEPSGVPVWQPMHCTCPSVKPAWAE